MAHAKKVNFHFLSPIVFPADFGPGVLGPLAPKGQNGQTYNGQIRQEPSKNSVKSLGQPSAWTPTCQSWTWTKIPFFNFLDDRARFARTADTRDANYIETAIPKAMQRYEILKVMVSAIKDRTEIPEVEGWKKELARDLGTMEYLQRYSQRLTTNRKEDFILQCTENIKKLQDCIEKCEEALQDPSRPYMASDHSDSDERA